MRIRKDKEIQEWISTTNNALREIWNKEEKKSLNQKEKNKDLRINYRYWKQRRSNIRITEVI